jgi:MEMO1 family protein
MKTTTFTYKEQTLLLELARNALASALKGFHKKLNRESLPSAMLQPFGAYVTLNKNGHLRGCIGLTSTEKPLYKTVQEMSMAAAFEDPRFHSLSKNELDEIDIEISVLSPLEKIKDWTQIELGKQGILIQKNGHTGLFLPQVATEMGWTLEEFLGHCAKDKAGLEWDDWKTSEIYCFNTLVFGEKDQSKTPLIGFPHAVH